jgi:hypothetical protein
VVELLELLLTFAGFAAGILLWAWLFKAPPADEAFREVIAGRPRQYIDTGPTFEPCWTEELGRGRQLIYARSLCVNDPLIELDARAARGDFPIPRSQE